MTRAKDRIMCPAYRCKPGTLLFGACTQEGTVAIFPDGFIIDADFVEEAKKQPVSPERRFRFAGKCIESGCKQWANGRCGIGDHVVKFIDQAEPIDPHFPCPIRKNCRWFLQAGYDACRICPYIPTEVTAEEVDAFFVTHGMEK
jgi:hypothetical protein